MAVPPPGEPGTDAGIDPTLLEMIVCPDCRAELEPGDGELVCGGCGLRYPVRDGIPVLLVDEALPPR